MSHTRYEWTLIDYAIWTAGAVTVPVYETSSAEQAEWILSDSGARACFVETAAFEQVIDGFRDRVPALEQVWRIEAGGPGGGYAGLADRRGAAWAMRSSPSGPGGPGGRLATIIYTSGTTGRPKGCELTHENLLSCVRNAFLGPLTTSSERGSSTLLFLPLAHVFARIIQVGCIEAGSCSGTAAIYRAAARAGLVPAHVHPRGAAGVREGVQRRRGEGHLRPEGRHLRLGGRAAIAYSLALDSPGRPAFGLRPSTRCSTGWSTASCGPRSAAGSIRHLRRRALSDRLCHFFRGVGVTVLRGTA